MRSFTTSIAVLLAAGLLGPPAPAQQNIIKTRAGGGVIPNDLGYLSQITVDSAQNLYLAGNGDSGYTKCPVEP
jgi:hypothetical protein